MFDRRVTLTGARLRLLFVAPYVGIPTAVRRVLAVRRAGPRATTSNEQRVFGLFVVAVRTLLAARTV